MSNKPFFSLIIPCYNPDEYIDRLFSSLTRQGIEKDDLEIIMVDDNSDSTDYREKVKDYGFEVIFVDTDVDFHCPGNTREAGLSHVNGKWLFFSDQDDFFEDDALKNVKAFIEENNPPYVVNTIMRGYNVEHDAFIRDYVHTITWLHGKFYSVDNLIKPFDIHFKKDLESHEDVFFNDSIISKLYPLGVVDFTNYDIPTYRWVENMKSLSRTPTNGRNYLFEHFNDYLVSAIEPFWDVATTRHPAYANMVLMGFLHGYFYYEVAAYYWGYEDYKDTLETLNKWFKKIKDGIHITTDEIINFIYSDTPKYWRVMEDCKVFAGDFIPERSFIDFVRQLDEME